MKNFICAIGDNIDTSLPRIPFYALKKVVTQLKFPDEYADMLLHLMWKKILLFYVNYNYCFHLANWNIDKNDHKTFLFLFHGK